MSPDRLVERWGELGIGSAGLGERLIGRWSQPHRAYHGVGHLEAALDALAVLGGGRLETVAIFFHDAVWTLPGDPRHACDESRSADLARDWLAGTLPAGQLAEVERLILVTADHAPDPGDRPGQRVSDADLALLAADWPRYTASVHGLRAEAGLDGPGWAARRRDQIVALLERPRLYRVAPGSWERAARGNLTRELGLLV